MLFLNAHYENKNKNKNRPIFFHGRARCYNEFMLGFCESQKCAY